MGLSGISPWSLLLILLIVLLLFGTKRLRHLGKDLGAAMKGFKDGLDEKDKTTMEKSEHDAEFDEEKSVQDKKKED